MNKLRDTIAYICRHYPNKTDLSKARLAKMIYLADWKAAIQHGCQLTDIQWEYNYYGPYVRDIIDLVRSDRDFVVMPAVNYYGEYGELVAARRGVDYPSLTDADKEILDFVIDKTGRLSWDEFIRLVYSTYPIMTQSQFSKLDLVALASEYKESKRSD